MDKEYLKLKITDYQDIRKTFWTALIVLIGGLATLMISLDSYIKVFLFILGIIALSVLIYNIYQGNSQIGKLFFLLKKEQ